jgi:hypothetical protein
MKKFLSPMFVGVCILGGVITASTPTVSQLGDTRTRATSVAAPSQLGNLSTRGLVQTGNVMIAGFILTGTDPKQVIVRGLGPILTSFGVLDALQDPVLELHNATSLITSNGDWQSAANAAQIPVTPVDYRPPATAAGTQTFDPTLNATQGIIYGWIEVTVPAVSSVESYLHFLDFFP